MNKNVPLETALDLALANVTLLPDEECDLLQAVGRVLAMPLQASVNLPPFDRSPLDGYALRSADTAGAGSSTPAVFKVTEMVPAGYTAKGRVEPGIAIKVATGAPLPPGADCIIRFEDTRQKGDLVEIDRPLTAGSGIVWSGEDVQNGEVLLTEGQLLGSAEIGLLAALGHRRVKVYCRPRVAVISVGDELEAQAGPLKPGKIYDSNRYALASGVMEAGGQADIFGPLPDRIEPLQEMLKALAPEYDLVITTGGVSVGDYDVVPRTFQATGAKTLFWKASFKPGSPVCVALLNSTLLVGLSGNPAAATISFELLARPVITRMGGRRDWQRQRAVVTLDDAFERGGSQRRFLRAQAYFDGSRLRARLTGSQSPGILKSMIGCNALLDVPGGHGPVGAGDELEAILL